jgi:hypothetical protein
MSIWNLTEKAKEMLCVGCRGTGKRFDAEDEEDGACPNCGGSGLPPNLEPIIPWEASAFVGACLTELHAAGVVEDPLKVRAPVGNTILDGIRTLAKRPTPGAPVSPPRNPSNGNPQWEKDLDAAIMRSAVSPQPGTDCPLCESPKSVSGGSCSQCGSDAEQFAHILNLERAQWAKGFLPEAAASQTQQEAADLAKLVKDVLRTASPTPGGHRALHLDAKDYYRLLELADATPQPEPAGAGVDLGPIEARCKAASPGPWITCNPESAFKNWPIGFFSLGRDEEAKPSNWAISTDHVRASEMTSGGAKADAEFIAHARQDIPALIAEVRRLRARSPASPPRDPDPTTDADWVDAVMVQHCDGKVSFPTAIRRAIEYGRKSAPHPAAPPRDLEALDYIDLMLRQARRTLTGKIDGATDSQLFSAHVKVQELQKAAAPAPEETPAPGTADERCPVCKYPWLRKPGEPCPTADCNYVEPAPGTPIEAAAREEAELSAFYKWRQGVPYEASPTAAARKAWMARASLSGLPQESAGPATWATGDFTQQFALYNMLMAWGPDECKAFYTMLSRRPDFNPATRSDEVAEGEDWDCDECGGVNGHRRGCQERSDNPSNGEA